MDFQSLSRKDLQTLCKKNMIPANITNVGMAEALAALQQVAGIEEFLNPIECESQQSEERIDIGTPGNCRTAGRTSTRKKQVKEPPTTQSIIRTRRGRVGEMADQENKDLNISSTPSFPSNRRRAPVPSARKKLETDSIEGKEEEKDQNNGDQKRSDVLETPSMPKTQRKVSLLGSTRRKTEARMDKSSVQGARSTRRSIRLLEKNMEKLSLIECGSVEPVAVDKLFDKLPERKEFCEQKITESDDDSKEALGLGIDESDDLEGMNVSKEKEEEQANDGKESKEEVQMEDENEEDNTITDKEPQDKIQSEAAMKDQCEPEDKIQSEAAIEEQHSFPPSSNDECSTENFSNEKDLSAQSPLLREKVDLDITVQHEVLKENSEIQSETAIKDPCEPEGKIQSEAAIEEQHAFTPSCNDECSTENFSKEKDLAAQSPLLREKVDLDITVQHEVFKENSEIITEETVEFYSEDLVDINVEEAELQHVKAQDSVSEPKMELQVLSDGENSLKDMVEFYFGELIDVDVMESELVENFDSKDSVPEPKVEDLSKSDEILVVNQEVPYEEDSEVIDNSSFTPFAKDSVPEPKVEDLSKSDEILVVNQEVPYEEDSEVIDNSSFTPFAVDQIPGQFPCPTAEVPVKESRTSLEVFNSADQDKDMKNNFNDDEERNLSLRQLRKMIKELHLSKKSSKEKTYDKEQVEKVVRTALQPLSENCLAKDGQEKTTAANSMFI